MSFESREAGVRLRALLCTNGDPVAIDLLSTLQRSFERVEFVTDDAEPEDGGVHLVVFDAALGLSFPQRFAALHGPRPPTSVVVVDRLTPPLLEQIAEAGIDHTLETFGDLRAPSLFAFIARMLRREVDADARFAFFSEASTACGLRYAEMDLSDKMRLTHASEVQANARRRTSQALLGTPGLSLLPPDARGEAEKQLGADIHYARTHGVAPPGRVTETPFYNVDGSVGHRRVFLRVLMGANGQPRAIASYSTDTSDLRRAKAALRRSDEHYRRLFESINDAIVIFRPSDERILEVNQRACDLYGWAHDEFVGRSLLDISIEPIEGRKRIEELLRSKEVATFRTRQRRADGSIMNLEVSASLFEFCGEQAIVSFSRDVTRLDEIEQSLRLHRERLERAATMETIGRITSGVAHDFNNILAIVHTCSTLLEETLEGEPRRRVIAEDISMAVQRGAGLVRQLLGTSANSEARPVLIEDVTRNMERLLRYFVLDSIIVEFELAPEPRPVLADPTQLEQILLNLVANAKDAIGEHGRIRIITRTQRLAGGSAVLLEVVDDGCGMDQKTLDQALEPFFTTKGTHGNGVGLALVASIVRELGGELTLESSFGKGTRVIVALPTHTSVHVGSTVTQSSN